MFLESWLSSLSPSLWESLSPQNAFFFSFFHLLCPLCLSRSLPCEDDKQNCKTIPCYKSFFPKQNCATSYMLWGQHFYRLDKKVGLSDSILIEYYGPRFISLIISQKNKENLEVIDQLSTSNALVLCNSNPWK